MDDSVFVPTALRRTPVGIYHACQKLTLFAPKHIYSGSLWGQPPTEWLLIRRFGVVGKRFVRIRRLGLVKCYSSYPMWDTFSSTIFLRFAMLPLKPYTFSDSIRLPGHMVP